jgi:GTPase SAR1 family protein
MEAWDESLEDILKAGTSLTEPEIELVARAVSHGLVSLHDRDTHHGAIHPGRIVSVGDIWKLIPAGPSGANGARIPVPEQRQSQASDLYAFGITFLHVFLSAKGTQVPLDRLAIKPDQWLSAIPEAWQPLFRRCLQADPNRRGTAHDLISHTSAAPSPVLTLTTARPGIPVEQQYNAPTAKLTVGTLEQQKREIETDITKINADITALRSDRVIRLGIFGVRGSGKSSLLAAWSLFLVDRTDPKRGLQLRFPDDDSLRYLKDVRQPILKEGKSHPTAMGVPQKIHFRVVTEEKGVREEWNIETMDFSGEFVELLADKTGRSFAKQTHDFLKKCDVILCCHRWNDNSQETLEAINRVLSDFSSQFVLALTRLDERGDVPRSKGALEGTLKELERESPVYFGNLIANVLDICRRNGRVGIMAICPLGKNFSDPRHFPRGRELSVDDLKPIAIHEPLRYAVDRKKEKQPDLKQRLQVAKAELARITAKLETAKAVRERQRQSQREEVRDSFLELKERVLQYLDRGKVPPHRDRHALTHLAHKAGELKDFQLQKECNQLLKRVGSVQGRISARWRQVLEFIVLLFVAVLAAGPLLWIVWLLFKRG